MSFLRTRARSVGVGLGVGAKREEETWTTTPAGDAEALFREKRPFAQGCLKLLEATSDVFRAGVERIEDLVSMTLCGGNFPTWAGS